MIYFVVGVRDVLVNLDSLICWVGSQSGHSRLFRVCDGSQEGIYVCSLLGSSDSTCWTLLAETYWTREGAI